VFPVLVVMFMALVQWGLYFHAQSLVDAAAQDSTRAAQAVDGTVDDARQVAGNILGGATSSGLLEGLRVEVDDQADTVRTTVRARVRSLVPLPGFSPVVVGISQAAKERFVAEQPG
jgi:Flp pilus assembly protein TadG